ncbi:YkgJ family cysteine cluster protein [Candidatus Woesearchaeota archaeon]|nr:YkgJ family cysteine cluster protein [Candidatus Woesearchaeota archaeon]
MITKETPLQNVLEVGAECERCGHCCSIGNAYMLNEDVKRVASFFAVSEETLKQSVLEETNVFNTRVYKIKRVKRQNSVFSPCMFFREDAGCIIHDVKPMHCKVCSTKSKQGKDLSHWFALNFLVKEEDPKSVRQWAHSIKGHGTIPGGEPHELVLDKDRLAKILSYEHLK